MAMLLAASILLFSLGPSQLPPHHFNFLLNVLISFYNFHLSTNIVFKQGYQNYILTSLWWKFHRAKIHATWNYSIYARATQKEMEKDDFEGVMTSQMSNI
jgi:dipeptidase